MNKYETTIIIKGSLTEVQKEEIIDKIEKFIKENGKITKKELIGIKKLAYEVQKETYGYYYIIQFEGKSEMIVELERIYRITDEIIKFMTLRK